MHRTDLTTRDYQSQTPAAPRLRNPAWEGFACWHCSSRHSWCLPPPELFPPWLLGHHTLWVSSKLTGPTSCLLCWPLNNSPTSKHWSEPRFCPWTSPLYLFSLRSMPFHIYWPTRRLPWVYISAQTPPLNSRFIDGKHLPLDVSKASRTAHPKLSSWSSPKKSVPPTQVS